MNKINSALKLVDEIRLSFYYKVLFGVQLILMSKPPCWFSAVNQFVGHQRPDFWEFLWGDLT